jgi:PEP-CTERM motif-containing protein
VILRALGVLLVLVLAFPLDAVRAVPITGITHLNSFRDSRGVNDVGVAAGEVNQFGADVAPSAINTTILGVQGGFTVGPNQCGPLAVNASFCATGTAFSSSRLGSWTLTFQNGTDVATAVTPSLAGLPAEPAPFPTSVSISNTGTTPTLSWTVPAGFTPDAVRVNVFDKSLTRSNGAKDIIFTTALGPTQTTFQIPANNPLNPTQPLLTATGQYVLNVQLIETRGHAPLVGNNNDNILRRSNSYFDFSPRTGPQPVAFLPSVGPGVGAPYQFSVAGVRAGQTIFIDPLVAIGYKYAIGAGNPNFASVTLPPVGDNLFFLSFLLGQTITGQQLAANTQFFFPQGGVNAFEVTGIETSAMLDPSNVTAFITGLTFAGDGDFTGTMTPLIAEVPDLAATPEPATLLLLGSSLGGLGLARWRQRRKQQAAVPVAAASAG